MGLLILSCKLSIHVIVSLFFTVLEYFFCIFISFRTLEPAEFLIAVTLNVFY